MPTLIFRKSGSDGLFSVYARSVRYPHNPNVKVTQIVFFASTQTGTGSNYIIVTHFVMEMNTQLAWSAHTDDKMNGRGGAVCVRARNSTSEKRYHAKFFSARTASRHSGQKAKVLLPSNWIATPMTYGKVDVKCWNNSKHFCTFVVSAAAHFHLNCRMIYGHSRQPGNCALRPITGIAAPTMPDWKLLLIILIGNCFRRKLSAIIRPMSGEKNGLEKRFLAQRTTAHGAAAWPTDGKEKVKVFGI